MRRIVQANRLARNRQITARYRMASCKVQLVHSCHGWAIASDNPIGFHSYQLKTRKIVSSAQPITNTGQLSSGITLLVCFVHQAYKLFSPSSCLFYSSCFLVFTVLIMTLSLPAVLYLSSPHLIIDLCLP
jgi:hypothetical protein